jgi:hypothetical protein
VLSQTPQRIESDPPRESGAHGGSGAADLTAAQQRQVTSPTSSSSPVPLKLRHRFGCSSRPIACRHRGLRLGHVHRIGKVPFWFAQANAGPVENQFLRLRFCLSLAPLRGSVERPFRLAERLWGPDVTNHRAKVVRSGLMLSVLLVAAARTHSAGHGMSAAAANRFI